MPFKEFVDPSVIKALSEPLRERLTLLSHHNIETYNTVVRTAAANARQNTIRLSEALASVLAALPSEAIPVDVQPTRSKEAIRKARYHKEKIKRPNVRDELSEEARKLFDALNYEQRSTVLTAAHYRTVSQIGPLKEHLTAILDEIQTAPNRIDYMANLLAQNKKHGANRAAGNTAALQALLKSVGGAAR